MLSKEIKLFLGLITCVAFFTDCFASTTSDVFIKYPNKYFVETGSYIGDGIQNALTAGCFEQIYSIELSPKYYQIASTRFKDHSNVMVRLGDSSVVLEQVLNSLESTATFWLDGHCSMGDTAKGETMTPLMRELEQIKKHHIKTHTILIDDIRMTGEYHFDYLTTEEIIAKLYEINPDYSITFENGYVQNDVLVAFIR